MFDTCQNGFLTLGSSLRLSLLLRSILVCSHFKPSSFSAVGTKCQCVLSDLEGNNGRFQTVVTKLEELKALRALKEIGASLECVLGGTWMSVSHTHQKPQSGQYNETSVCPVSAQMLLLVLWKDVVSVIRHFYPSAALTLCWFRVSVVL